MLARWQGASLTRQLIPSAFRPLTGLRFLLGQAEQPASGRFFWRTGRPGGCGFAAILAQLELFSLSAKVGANHASPSSAIVAFLDAFRRCKYSCSLITNAPVLHAKRGYSNVKPATVMKEL